MEERCACDPPNATVPYSTAAFRVRFSSLSHFFFFIVVTIFFHVILVGLAFANTTVPKIYPGRLLFSGIMKAFTGVLFAIFMVLGMVNEENRVYPLLSIFMFEMLIYNCVVHLLCSLRLRLPRPQLFDRLRMACTLFFIWIVALLCILIFNALVIPEEAQDDTCLVFYFALIIIPFCIYSIRCSYMEMSTHQLDVFVGECHVAYLIIGPKGWNHLNTEQGQRINFKWPDTVDYDCNKRPDSYKI